MTGVVSRGRTEQRDDPGDWLICRHCQGLVYRKRFDRFDGVCPECGWHSARTAQQRLAALLDEGTAEPVVARPVRPDPLGFVDLVAYPDRLAAARRSTGLDDVVAAARGTVLGHPLVAAAMDFRFLGGSLGSAAGEAVTAAAEAARAEGTPLVVVTASGGARMQEGALSLMQMVKTSNAMAELDEAGLLTVTLVTDPTYGGVAASFATLSDVIVAEPAARMGFAGPRVIEQTTGRRLPEGFQTAEFLLAHGHVDDVRPRQELPRLVAGLLSMTRPGPPGWGREVADPVRRDPASVVDRPAADLPRLARDLRRPTALDHVHHWADGFVELHGDRMGADCPAVVGGLGSLAGLPVMFLGHQKGHTTAELVQRRFGMPSPAGYRKAQRLMRLAAKLGVPLVTLVDTPGADPGLEAEEQGQAGAVAECLRTMGRLPVPVVSVVTGEGGSGGALALAVADRVLICENGMYSVISPEGCAAILWRDPTAAPRAADALRIGARSMLDLGVVDGVVPEPDGGAQSDPGAASELVRRAVVAQLRDLLGRAGDDLVRSRRARFRGSGAAGTAATRRDDARW